MSATVHAFGRRNASPPALPRTARVQAAPAASDNSWMVDVLALVQCRDLLSGHAPASERPRVGHQALLDVPPAYEQFCRNHFASVQRLHPEMRWTDACQAYAIALSAHSLLWDELGDANEALLGRFWPCIRGDSRLEWKQARPLVADGCSALARIDPLAMRR